MASVIKDDIRLESAFMSTLWNFIKHFWTPEDGDEYWDELHSRTDELVKQMEKKAKDENTPCDLEFCKSMLLGYANYLDRKWRSQKRKERERQNE